MSFREAISILNKLLNLSFYLEGHKLSVANVLIAIGLCGCLVKFVGGLLR